MNSIEDKLEYLKGLNNTINSLESDVLNTLSQNRNLLDLKNKLEEHNKVLTQENVELAASKNELINILSKKEKELFALKSEVLEQNGSASYESTIRLGINNISVRNEEAIIDALKYFDKKCPYCNKDLFLTTKRKKLEIDHFLPVKEGGQDVPWNLLPVCHTCNRKKGGTLPHLFLEKNSFEEVSNYLKGVHQKFLDEAIDSYTFKEKLGELIEKEYFFIRRNIHSKFITTLLYLAEKHHIIKDGITYVEKKEHSEKDRKTGRIIEYLDKEIPKDWENFDLIERRNFLKGNDIIPDSSRNFYQREIVCIAEIWCECLGKGKEDMDRYVTREINDIMKSLDDWKPNNSTKRFAIYGVQRFYERKTTKENTADYSLKI